MNKRFVIHFVVAAVLISALRAGAAGNATVALITNDQGAHVSAYLPALAECKEVSGVVLADSSGRTFAAARRTLGNRLVATFSTTRELLAHHRPNLALISL